MIKGNFVIKYLDTNGDKKSKFIDGICEINETKCTVTYNGIITKGVYEVCRISDDDFSDHIECFKVEIEEDETGHTYETGNDSVFSFFNNAEPTISEIANVLYEFFKEAE